MDGERTRRRAGLILPRRVQIGPITILRRPGQRGKILGVELRLTGYTLGIGLWSAGGGHVTHTTIVPR